MSRFVRPETAKIDLTGGDWLIVKRRLTAGEQRHAFARLVKRMTIGEKTELDPEATGLAKIVAYLLDWSLKDDTGTLVVIRDQPVSVVEAAILSLDPDSFREIHDAVQAHEAREDAALDAEKKKEGWRAQIISDLRICQLMHWTYDELLDLPASVYDVLLEHLNAEARALTPDD